MASSSSSDSKKPPYLVRTSSLGLSALDLRPHPIDETNYRYSATLGDSTGLTKLGVHFCRLPAGATSTTLHWHSHEDEWFYVVHAGEDARLLVWEPEDKDSSGGEGEGGAEGGAEGVVPREERVQTGDFVGFKAGVRRARAFRAGGEEMVYLAGGSREPVDVTYYPTAGKRQVNDMVNLEGSWTVEDKDVKTSVRKAPRLVVDVTH